MRPSASIACLALLLYGCSSAPLAAPDAGSDLDAGEPQSDAGPPPDATPDVAPDARVYSDDADTGWCVPGDCYCGCIRAWCGAVTCGDAGRWLLMQCADYSTLDGGAPRDADTKCTSSARGICVCAN